MSLPPPLQAIAVIQYQRQAGLSVAGDTAGLLAKHETGRAAKQNHRSLTAMSANRDSTAAPSPGRGPGSGERHTRSAQGHGQICKCPCPWPSRSSLSSCTQCPSLVQLAHGAAVLKLGPILCPGRSPKKHCEQMDTAAPSHTAAWEPCAVCTTASRSRSVPHLILPASPGLATELANGGACAVGDCSHRHVCSMHLLQLHAAERRCSERV